MDPFHADLFGPDYSALARLADSVHGFDSRIIMQLALHGGRERASAVTHKPCLAPSAIESPLYKEIPHELTKDEILELVRGLAGGGHSDPKSWI